MKFAVLMFAAVGVLATSPVAPAEAAQGASQAHKKRAYVLKGTSYVPRRRAYSFSYGSVIEKRKFVDPSLGPRAQGEPFDNGFFFETPTGPFGGYTPYMH